VEKALPHWKRSFVLDPENEAVARKLTENDVDLAPLREEAEALKAAQAEEAEEEAPESATPAPGPIEMELEPEPLDDEGVPVTESGTP
jgi:hypothetical protein